VIASVGTTGDSYDNTLAETVNRLYKSEVIEYLKEQWHGVNVAKDICFDKSETEISRV